MPNDTIDPMARARSGQRREFLLRKLKESDQRLTPADLAIITEIVSMLSPIRQG